MPSLKEMIFGKSPKIKQFQNLSPFQQKFQNQLLSGVSGLTPSMFDLLEQLLSQDEEATSDYEAPALRQFQEQIIPSILERFAGAGALSSSGLNQSLAKAGESLSEKLAAQRSGLQQNALQSLMGLSQVGLQQRSTPYTKQGSQGLIGALAPAAGGLAGGYLANRWGF
jgi:hypothetical protein